MHTVRVSLSIPVEEASSGHSPNHRPQGSLTHLRWSVCPHFCTRAPSSHPTLGLLRVSSPVGLSCILSKGPVVPTSSLQGLHLGEPGSGTSANSSPLPHIPLPPAVLASHMCHSDVRFRDSAFVFCHATFSFRDRDYRGNVCIDTASDSPVFQSPAHSPS